MRLKSTKIKIHNFLLLDLVNFSISRTRTLLNFPHRIIALMVINIGMSCLIFILFLNTLFIWLFVILLNRLMENIFRLLFLHGVWCGELTAWWFRLWGFGYFACYFVFIALMVVRLVCHDLRVFWSVYCGNWRLFLYLW